MRRRERTAFGRAEIEKRPDDLARGLGGRVRQRSPNRLSGPKAGTGNECRSESVRSRSHATSLNPRRVQLHIIDRMIAPLGAIAWMCRTRVRGEIELDTGQPRRRANQGTG